MKQNNIENEISRKKIRVKVIFLLIKISGIYNYFYFNDKKI